MLMSSCGHKKDFKQNKIRIREDIQELAKIHDQGMCVTAATTPERFVTKKSGLFSSSLMEMRFKMFYSAPACESFVFVLLCVCVCVCE